MNVMYFELFYLNYFIERKSSVAIVLYCLKTISKINKLPPEQDRNLCVRELGPLKNILDEIINLLKYCKRYTLV